MKTLLRNSILLLTIVCGLVSCDDTCVAEQHIQLPHAEWHKDSIVTVRLPVSDTLSGNAIILTLRHNDNYPYNNIILSVTTESPQGMMLCDTVEYRLADAQESWEGKRSGKWIDHRLAFRTNVQFQQSGDYKFTIAQLMRNEELKGVGAVGVRIEKQE